MHELCGRERKLTGLRREHTGELGSWKERGVVVSPTLFLANTGVMQIVFNSLESGFRYRKTQKYKIMRKRAWGSNERILLTFLRCSLTST